LTAFGNGSALPRKFIGIRSGIRNGTRQGIRSGGISLTVNPAVKGIRTGSPGSTRIGLPDPVNDRWKKAVSPERRGPGAEN
jgi:hypothetical protein